ncbi:hypothetical protein PAHAL_7G109000 [Panicum hallii]|uniref:Uncharacterized protein n=1 Tax=Panicum hallii TaxID=206008 RepID=A0A2T8IBR5_9POAL|nr:hypothetical protein PAHAL_7G109000 [Panicum hallii]
MPSVRPRLPPGTHGRSPRLASSVFLPHPQAAAVAVPRPPPSCAAPLPRHLLRSLPRRSPRSSRSQSHQQQLPSAHSRLPGLGTTPPRPSSSQLQRRRKASPSTGGVCAEANPEEPPLEDEERTLCLRALLVDPRGGCWY